MVTVVTRGYSNGYRKSDISPADFGSCNHVTIKKYPLMKTFAKSRHDVVAKECMGRPMFFSGYMVTNVNLSERYATNRVTTGANPVTIVTTAK